MADIKISINKLYEYEGLYSNDPNDPGGETWKGIARKKHPNWEGWKIVDRFKINKPTTKELIGLLKTSNQLEELVVEFYKDYIKPINFEKVPSQLIADEIFEQAVNLGLKQAVKHLQIACNLLNNQASLYPDITTNGEWDGYTYSSLLSALKYRNEKLLFNVLNILQGARYVELMLTNFKFERFIGWFNRIEIKK